MVKLLLIDKNSGLEIIFCEMLNMSKVSVGFKLKILFKICIWSDSFPQLPQCNFTHSYAPADISTQWGSLAQRKTLKWDVFVISMKLGKKLDF